MNSCSDALFCSGLCSTAGRCLIYFCLVILGQLSVTGGPSDDEINWHQERQFWSFQSPASADLPAVKNPGWTRQGLDFFVLSQLENRGLSPAPEADKQTLIRRLSFDLTGLPPAWEDVERFVQDTSDEAYSRLVERLLASPRFGERMASLWLPLVRYAEDQAFQVGTDTKMFYPNAYKYRQWVIDSFNNDLPYDRFIQLQLAADLIEGTNSPNLAALGLIGLGPKYYNRGRLDVMADEWEDRVDTVTRTFLGLTVSCSRCHDHKFDPITTEDYYGLAGVFASIRMVNRRPDGQLEADKTEAAKMDPDTLHVVQDGTVTNLNIFIRGNVERKGPIVPRRFLRILSDGAPAPFGEGSGRRELAEAIADPRNPLTARVIVNRFWGMIFGQPLVRTASNFGHAGEPPTHPELLDWLALRLIEHGWSVKTLVREFVLSAAYRQSSGTPSGSAVQSGREWLAGMNRRRLTVEQWRDAALFVSGNLDYAGGKSLELDDSGNRRRTVQARISRLKLDDLLMQWDYPDANVHAEKRSVSTTATQKLFMLNSPFVLARAKALARRIQSGQGVTTEARLQRAYRLVYGREATDAEIELAREFLSRDNTSRMSRWEQFAQILLISNEILYVD